MIGRVRSRQEFSTLGRSGRRITATFLWCNWCLVSGQTQPKVAFAITRAYGSAVQRNLLRRRIRALLELLDRRESLPPVTMLIGVRRAKPDQRHPRNDLTSNKQTFDPTFAQLEHDVLSLVAAIRQTTGSTPAEPGPSN